jgi:hypothetical protein
MSASGSPKADLERHDWHVRFVPEAAICIAAKQHLYSITSSVRAGSLEIDDQFEFGWFLYPGARFAACSASRMRSA